jgi:hypothetical protein
MYINLAVSRFFFQVLEKKFIVSMWVGTCNAAGGLTTLLSAHKKDHWMDVLARMM